MRKLLFTTLFVLLIAGGCAAPRRAATPDAIARHTENIVLSPRGAKDESEIRTSPRQRSDFPRMAGVIAERANAAIVRVRSELTHGAQSQTSGGDRVHATTTRLGGTGVIIARDGIILTNEHVIRHAKRVTIDVADGTTHEARRILAAPRIDLAVLWIDVPTESALTIADGSAKPGARVVAVSAARRDRPRDVRSGVVTRRTVSLQNELDVSRKRYYDDLIESTADLEPGFSGGPLLNMDGHLLGINVAALADPSHDYARAYAIPLHSENRNLIQSLINQIRQSPRKTPNSLATEN